MSTKRLNEYSFEEKSAALQGETIKELKKHYVKEYQQYSEYHFGKHYKYKAQPEKSFEEIQSADDYELCKKLLRSRKDKTQRLKKRLSIMFQKPCLFLTLTFDNFYIALPFSENRERVRRFLKSLGCAYVANADWGKENGRLHFHAVVQLNHIDFNLWKFGNMAFQKIYISHTDESKIRLARYMIKLTFHSVKSSTCFSNIMYSRMPNIDTILYPLFPHEESTLILNDLFGD